MTKNLAEGLDLDSRDSQIGGQTTQNFCWSTSSPFYVPSTSRAVQVKQRTCCRSLSAEKMHVCSCMSCNRGYEALTRRSRIGIVMCSMTILVRLLPLRVLEVESICRVVADPHRFPAKIIIRVESPSHILLQIAGDIDLIRKMRMIERDGYSVRGKDIRPTSPFLASIASTLHIYRRYDGGHVEFLGTCLAIISGLHTILTREV